MSGRYIRRDGAYVGTVHTSGRYIRRDGTYVETVHYFGVLYRHCYRPDQRVQGKVSDAYEKHCFTRSN